MVWFLKGTHFLSVLSSFILLKRHQDHDKTLFHSTVTVRISVYYGNGFIYRLIYTLKACEPFSLSIFNCNNFRLRQCVTVISVLKQLQTRKCNCVSETQQKYLIGFDNPNIVDNKTKLNIQVR